MSSPSVSLSGETETPGRGAWRGGGGVPLGVATGRCLGDPMVGEGTQMLGSCMTSGPVRAPGQNSPRQRSLRRGSPRVSPPLAALPAVVGGQKSGNVLMETSRAFRERRVCRDRLSTRPCRP